MPHHHGTLVQTTEGIVTKNGTVIADLASALIPDKQGSCKLVTSAALVAILSISASDFADKTRSLFV